MDCFQPRLQVRSAGYEATDAFRRTETRKILDLTFNRRCSRTYGDLLGCEAMVFSHARAKGQLGTCVQILTLFGPTLPYCLDGDFLFCQVGTNVHHDHRLVRIGLYTTKYQAYFDQNSTLAQSLTIRCQILKTHGYRDQSDLGPFSALYNPFSYTRFLFGSNSFSKLCRYAGGNHGERVATDSHRSALRVHCIQVPLPGSLVFSVEILRFAKSEFQCE